VKRRRRRLRQRLALLLITPFEAAVAFAAMFAGAVYLLDPTAVGRSALGRTAQQLLPVWEVLYVTGGVAILISLMWRSLRLEVAGLALFVSAMLIQAIAIVDFAGAQGIASAATFAAVAAACIGRCWVLIDLWRHFRRDRRGR
jgi:hypothetical protein